MVGARTILITGASGFLGQTLASAAARHGWRVIGTSRRAVDSPQSDIRWEPTSYDVEHLRELLAQHAPGIIVHFAGNANVRVSVDQPLFDFEAGPPVLARVLEAVRREGGGIRVLFCSSAAVYGNVTTLPVTEDAPVHPISAYGHHKRMSEMLLEEYHSVYGVPTLAVRVFSAYGPGLRKQLLWDLCRRCRGGGPIELFGTGQETRDFIHAEDVASALLLLSTESPFQGEVLNVASGIETSIADAAGALMHAWGLPEKTCSFNGRQRPGDPLRWRANIDRLLKLGFQPHTALREGIASYVSWFRTHGETN